ncbi:hypothetical protein HN51_036550, partial [Arachis hypogaea]
SGHQSRKLKRRVEHSRLADSVDFLIFTTANVGEKWLKWQSLNWSRLNWYSRKEKLLRTQNALEQGTLYPEKYDNTVKEFTKALDLNPVYIKALVRRGAAHEKLEHFEETIAEIASFSLVLLELLVALFLVMFLVFQMENSKALLEIEQQQPLLNGKEIRNSDELRAIGVKDDDLLVMVRSGVGSGGGGAASCLVDEELSKKVKGSHPFESVV